MSSLVYLHTSHEKKMERKEQTEDVVRASATEVPAFFPNKSPNQDFEAKTNNCPVLVLSLGKVVGRGLCLFSLPLFTLDFYSLLLLFSPLQGLPVRLPCNTNGKYYKNKTEEE